MSSLDSLKALIGSENVLTRTEAVPYLTDWRNRYKGQALCVARPGSTTEVASIVRLCAKHNVPIVPQGGNTGLCGGATPDNSGSAFRPGILG